MLVGVIPRQAFKSLAMFGEAYYKKQEKYVYKRKLPTKKDFVFEWRDSGYCHVTYTSPANGQQWSNIIGDRDALLAVYGKDKPYLKDMKSLIKLIKEV